MLLFIALYVVMGVIAIILMAYDQFSQRFDFSLSGGWEFVWFQRYLAWLIVILLAPYCFYKEVVKKVSERKYVKEWRKNGKVTMPLKMK